MKKKIAILGSTGSIGKSLINILKCDKKNIEIKLISANKNINELLKQTKIFNVKNIIVSDYKKFIQLKKILHNKKINIYNNFNSIDKIFHENKIDYSMNAISGLNGLNPTLKIIKYSRNIAIANKESIICGWPLINKELIKNKTKFIPIDSEHYSIYSLIGGLKFGLFTVGLIAIILFVTGAYKYSLLITSNRTVAGYASILAVFSSCPKAFKICVI